MNRYQEIMRTVEADWHMGGLSDGLYGDFAATVARRAEEQVKAALREALDAWQMHLDVRWRENQVPAKDRIAALRAQFLDDKEPS